MQGEQENVGGTGKCMGNNRMQWEQQNVMETVECKQDNVMELGEYCRNGRIQF